MAMPNYLDSLRRNLHRFRQVEALLPFDNPTFDNPDFEDASYRVLIVRLSPFRDVDRSIPHLFLFQEVRRALPEAFVDLAFFPAKVDRALFEKEGTPPLIGVQSLRSGDEFDLILISNAYTLELINLPYLLIRSGFPLFSSQRGPEWPIIILGGSNAMATQAVIRQDGDSLVDGIFFGEGEGIVGDLVRLFQRHRGVGKRELLEQAAGQTVGFWAAGSLRPTRKAVLRTPEAQFLPVEYPILNSPEVHTASLQITYGCPAFCSFCFEGYDRKPYREMPLADVLSAARQLKRAQGNEELNLYSFNFNTHQDVLEMILALHRLFERVSLKSQRLDILQRTPTLLEAEIEADKREFTLGIEGISERLRAWLHKSLPTEDIAALLERLFVLKARRVKLFYLLTGHETEEDVEEFRRFLKWLKEARSARNRHVRVVFSFGLLVRMPFTPLRYDRLMLDEEAWRPLIGLVKSACETNGFEFRLAFDWPAYCVTQVLALGGYWLVEPLVALAQKEPALSLSKGPALSLSKEPALSLSKGYCFDTTLPPGYWEELRGWMEETGHWNDGFLGEKGPDYPFALEFVASDVSPAFLYAQYQEAQANVDTGYCLGSAGQPGRCLGCGACPDGEQRRAIAHHQVRQPAREEYLAQLREVMARKRRLQLAYFLLRLDPALAGVLPEFLNAFVFREILARYPELADNLLAVRESLFTVRPNDDRFPVMGGETVFALKAWDTEALRGTLADPETRFFFALCALRFALCAVVGPAEGFTPGEFTRLHLDVHLPGDFFPEPRVHLEQYLRSAYLPYSLRREGTRYRFDLPAKALKKKILFGGFFEAQEDDFFASLDVGPKFDLLAFLRTFGQGNLFRQVQVQVSRIEWQ
jgi:radical SAM superfamily enzyme YgiQ (UPF0313 family)